MRPFDDEVQSYVVVANHDNQHALWPDPVAVPAGWTIVHGPAGHAACLAHVNRSWTDMRPQGPTGRS